jgi:hypothetical protein
MKGIVLPRYGNVSLHIILTPMEILCLDNLQSATLLVLMVRGGT